MRARGLSGRRTLRLFQERTIAMPWTGFSGNVSAGTFRRGTFAGYTVRILSGRSASEILRLPGGRPNIVLKFAQGGVERYRESALPADNVGPLEIYS